MKPGKAMVFKHHTSPTLWINLLCLALSNFLAPPLFAEQQKKVVLPLDKQGAQMSALIFYPPEVPVFAAIYSYGAIVEREGISKSAELGYDVIPFGEELARLGALAVIPERKSDMDGAQTVISSRNYLIQRGFKPEKIALIGFSRGGGVTLAAAANLKTKGPVVLMSPALYGDYMSDFTKLHGPVLITLGEKDPMSIRTRVLTEIAPNCKRHALPCHIHEQYPGNHKSFWKVRKDVWRDIGRFLTASTPLDSKK
jgi:hypothetical protein